MGRLLEEEETAFEPAPAQEIHFDDVGRIVVIERKVWFPLILRRPVLFGPDKICRHIVAWGVTDRDIVAGAAYRALIAVGEEAIEGGLRMARLRRH